MENKNKIIIIALIVVIVALLVGIVATMSVVDKTDTNVTYKGKSKITEGDPINLKLTDVNGTPLANQTVNITITDKDDSSDYHSVVTNAKGIGKLKLDKPAGKYTVFIKYYGNENYSSCNFTKKITIDKEVKETVSESSANNYPEYNPDLGYYKPTGIRGAEWSVVELADGRNVVVAGDGYYEYIGLGSDGYPLHGNFLGHGGHRIN